MRLRDLIETENEVPIELLDDAMSSENMEEKGVAHYFLAEQFGRIIPSPDCDFYGEFLVNYYVSCIEYDLRPTAEEYVHSRFEAAWDMQRLFEYWIGLADQSMGKHIGYLVRCITASYRHRDILRRNAIETGYLEHGFVH